MSVPLVVIGPPVNTIPVEPPDASTLVTVPPDEGGVTAVALKTSLICCCSDAVKSDVFVCTSCASDASMAS
jgi:hypothetical protein